MVSELYLLRHAKAVPQNGGTRDRDRPIEARGRDDARAIARWIKDHEWRPDLVLCSPATRTRETLDLVLPAFPHAPEVRYDKELYLVDSDSLLALLRELPDRVRRIMVVGHNPGLHELARSLSDVTSGPLMDRLALNLPTAALACFEINTEWSALRHRTARLAALVTPKDLRDKD